MTFLKSIFGNKKSNEDKEFTKDFEDALTRYFNAPGSTIDYEYKDKKGNIIPPSYAFEKTYQEWKKIKSIWDKRSVIFSALDELYLNDLKLHQVVERFIIDRYPKQALLFVKEHSSEEDFADESFLTSLAKYYFVMTEYDSSIKYAKEALLINPELKKAKIVLADSLHLSNNHKESHEIYNNILKNSKLKDWHKDEINILEIVSFNDDILNSSVYAVSLLNNDETDEASWNQISGEFYFCPYFRSQHAFWLINNGENLKGIAKLMSLSQEFPWFKDGIINAKSVIMQYREQLGSNELWENELKSLNDIIKENGW